MSSLLVTLPVSFLLSAVLLWLVLKAVRSGSFDDWDGPAERHLYDDDRAPELDASRVEPLDHDLERSDRDEPGSERPYSSR